MWVNVGLIWGRNMHLATKRTLVVLPEADPPSILCWVLVALASGRNRHPRTSRFIMPGQSTCMRSSPVEINLTNCQKSFPRPPMLMAACHTDSACNNADGWIFNFLRSASTTKPGKESIPQH